ncbi:MAG: hypothetical protein GY821_04885 [Gammaproteobacteria bacterium]|nr:hypothetical protein [Gammaproteobacteria bacterium]MCP4473897.1 hypothetical protein [Gammaproteobacteria bacterium]
MKHINYLAAIAALPLLLPTILWANQCPDSKQVLVAEHWHTPAQWQLIPLSPLAATAAGNITISARGLYQVYYLNKKQQLRCIYSKPGTGVVGNTYVIARKLTTFHPEGQGAWVFDGDSTWRCSMTVSGTQRKVMPAQHCRWSILPLTQSVTHPPVTAVGAGHQ